MKCQSNEAFRRGALEIAAVAALLFALGGGDVLLRLHAQSPSAPSDIPDLAEIWARRGRIEGQPESPLVLTARAVGFSLAFDEALSPRYDCSPDMVPTLVTDPYNFQIEQQADRVILRYEKDDVVRTVWLEGHGHPKPGPYDYAIQGHSIGWYEKNQLVVVTSKFTFDPVGISESRHVPSSTLKKVTERYWREGDRLKVEVSTEDPLILREPFRFAYEWERTERELEPYNCDPEEARFPAQFQHSPYQDPDWVRLPATTGRGQ